MDIPHWYRKTVWEIERNHTFVEPTSLADAQQRIAVLDANMRDVEKKIVDRPKEERQPLRSVMAHLLVERRAVGTWIAARNARFATGTDDDVAQRYRVRLAKQRKFDREYPIRKQALADRTGLPIDASDREIALTLLTILRIRVSLLDDHEKDILSLCQDLLSERTPITGGELDE